MSRADGRPRTIAATHWVGRCRADDVMPDISTRSSARTAATKAPRSRAFKSALIMASAAALRMPM